MSASTYPGARPGMSDVARLAGVSHQTVSRVLNGHPNVRPATRDRVQAAIRELGYRRNSAARALVTRRSGAIGIVTTGSMQFGPATTLAVLEQSARAAGYFVTVAMAPDPTPEVLTGVLDSLMDQAVEGVVVIAPVEQVARAAQAVSAQLPVLLISAADADAFEPPVLHVDQAAGVHLVVEHLTDLGHRDVVHVAGPPEWFDAQVRQRAWWEALAGVGLVPRADLVGDWSAASGYAAAQELLTDLPQAVFASNDQMALGVLHAFAEAGVGVPEQVSVVGFDDVVGSDHYIPPLTTVQQDFVTLGRRAIEVLVAQIAGAEEVAEPVTPSLVVRASTGPAREAAPAGREAAPQARPSTGTASAGRQ